MQTLQKNPPSHPQAIPKLPTNKKLSEIIAMLTY